MLHFAQKRGGVPPSSFGKWAVAAAVALIAALVLLTVVSAFPTLGQEATPPLVPPGDPRSEGEGPGFGSGPVMAALVVIGLGLAAALATVAYVRLVRR